MALKFSGLRVGRACREEGARSHRELIDFSDLNSYPPIEIALPGWARHAANIREMRAALQVYFRSPRFKPVDGEEGETNPGCIGKALGQWLCEEFKHRGYVDAELIPEDWGWCVMCSREGCMQWIGCGSVLLSEACDENRETSWRAEEIVWTAFPEAEIPFYDFLGLFRRVTGRLNLSDIRVKLGQELRDVLDDADFITYCDSP